MSLRNKKITAATIVAYLFFQYAYFFQDWSNSSLYAEIPPCDFLQDLLRDYSCDSQFSSAYCPSSCKSLNEINGQVSSGIEYLQDGPISPAGEIIDVPPENPSGHHSHLARIDTVDCSKTVNCTLEIVEDKKCSAKTILGVTTWYCKELLEEQCFKTSSVEGFTHTKDDWVIEPCIPPEA